MKIEVAPRNSYIENGKIYAEFSKEIFIFTPSKDFSEDDLNKCGQYFIAGLIMMCNTEQIAKRMTELGFPGIITVKEN